MPGIVGLITRMPRQRCGARASPDVGVFRHENFYVTGTWVEESLGVYVGWIARKDSFSDGMPLRNERGDVVLVFAGEEFPEPGPAQRLKERGHQLDDAGPSYLTHLYEEDPSFPAGLNGRFHGLLTDRTVERRLCSTTVTECIALYYQNQGRVLFRRRGQSDSCRAP